MAGPIRAADDTEEWRKIVHDAAVSQFENDCSQGSTEQHAHRRPN